MATKTAPAPKATTATKTTPKTQARKKVRPLSDRVLVRPFEVDEMKRGALYIPDTAKERPQEGEIVATGPGKLDKEGKRIALDVSVGDRVLYGKYSGTEVTVGDTELLIMHEDDILAVL